MLVSVLIIQKRRDYKRWKTYKTKYSHLQLSWAMLNHPHRALLHMCLLYDSNSLPRWQTNSMQKNASSVCYPFFFFLKHEQTCRLMRAQHTCHQQIWVRSSEWKDFSGWMKTCNRWSIYICTHNQDNVVESPDTHDAKANFRSIK